IPSSFSLMPLKMKRKVWLAATLRAIDRFHKYGCFFNVLLTVLNVVPPTAYIDIFHNMSYANPRSPSGAGFATVSYSRRNELSAREAFPQYCPADRNHGRPAHAWQRLSLGPRADFPDHRALYARGSLRGGRRHRARRSHRPQGRAGRPSAAGRLPCPHVRGTGRLRFRRRG